MRKFAYTPEMFEWLSAKTIAVLLCGILLGGMLFFSFLLVPLLRHHLARPAARDLLRQLFPLYYHYNTALSIVAGIATALSSFAQEAVALAILGASFVFARVHLLRAIGALQPANSDPNPPGIQFRLLHGVLMVLNLGQMAAAAVVLVRLLDG
jgi:hypothetical protein